MLGLVVLVGIAIAVGAAFLRVSADGATPTNAIGPKCFTDAGEIQPCPTSTAWPWPTPSHS
jgi:hypothetical protein